MKHMPRFTGIIITIVFSFVCNAYAKDAIVVHLKSGAVVPGKLLQLDSEGITIDPQGFIKTQFFASSEIDYLLFKKSGEKILFPLNRNSAADSLSYQKRYSKRLYNNSDNRNWSLIGAYGMIKGSFEGGEYNTGEMLQIGIRRHFSGTTGPRKGMYAEFTYFHTTITPKYEHYEAGRKVVGVNNFSLNLGGFTTFLGNRSYLHIFFGFSIFNMGGGKDIGLVDSSGGLRLGLGGGIGVAKGVSVITTGGVDMTFLGVGEKEILKGSGVTREQVNTEGGFFYINFGLMYDF